MFSRKDAAPEMPSGVGALSSDQLDVLRQLGLLSPEQETDLSGQQQDSRDERPINERGERVTTEQQLVGRLAVQQLGPDFQPTIGGTLHPDKITGA